MKPLDKLDSHLKTRLRDLSKAKEQGRKVIGYPAGGYLPEELVLACDAIPICFIQAGDNAVLRDAGNYVCRWFDPFWRSQIGYLTSRKDPYYTIVDLIAIPITDNHVRAFSNTAGCYTPEVQSFVFGVPHVKDKLALDYYLQGINRLKKKLEEFTGIEITDSRIRRSIELCNRERELFREISIMRKSENFAATSKNFVALNHGSFLADKETMIDILESFIKEFKGSPPLSNNGPRILLTGSTLAQGDSKVMDITEDTGGVIVMEEFAEGIRPYWGEVKTEGDLMANLAESYFMERVCPGWFRPGTERLDFLVKLARDYSAAGLIWYQLMFRESYKVESYFFPDKLKKETGLPMLVVESEYDAKETGPMKTRIETFMEMLTR
ncbi:MAG: 2-hydroxyacyl-CoA dehydratase [Deltaproteobacteria bacterium]|nr:MAG: 2-hydroxyacyl-CoA dehydratase [Deltaproteobacteria bacterium]